MALSEEEVKKVAELARLSLDEGEVKTFAGQLSAILEYIETLNEIDTDDIKPTSHALDIVNVLREDKAEKKFDDNVWQKNAPAADHGHFRVPRVIEE